VLLSQELFKPSEYTIAFWYLEYLLDLRLQNFNMVYRDPKLLSSSDTKAGKKNKKGKKDKAKPLPARPQRHPLTADILVLQATAALSRALFLALFVYERIGVPVPKIDAAHRASWFSHRFAVVSRLPQPQSLTLAQFDDIANYHMKQVPNPEKLFEMAISAFTLVRSLISKALEHPKTTPLPPSVPQLKSLQAVAVANSAQLLRHLKGAAGSFDQYRLQVNFKLNSTFPVLSLAETPQK
jgi:hypothetical protein